VQTLHLPGAYHGGPALHTLVGNIDADPELEIVVTGTAAGPLYAWNHDGTPVAGWPVSPASGAGVAYPGLGKLSNAFSALQAFAGHWDQPGLAAWAGTGALLPGWPKPSANYITSPPSLVDIDGDGIDEIFIAEEDSKVHAYRADGSRPLGGLWPVYENFGPQGRGTPAVADLDGDGSPDIVAVTDGSAGPFGEAFQILAYNKFGGPLDGFPVTLPGTGWRYPAIGDVDADGAPEIVVVTRTGAGIFVLVVSVQGRLERSMGPAVHDVGYDCAPALGDLDGDGFPEIIVETDGALDAWKGDGSVFPGWPQVWSSSLTVGCTAPVVGDVDGDLQPDIVIVSQDGALGEVRVYSRHGALHSHFPKVLIIGSGYVPAIADLDLDGRNEIVITGDFWGGQIGLFDKVWVYDLGGGPHGPVQWGQLMAGPRHHGFFPAVEHASLRMADVSVPEGGAGTTLASFVATLSAPLPQTVTVKYQTADGTAVAGEDYDAATGIATFLSGATTATLRVPLRGDRVLESDETFSVTLSNATGGAVLADPPAIGTILNDDAPGITIDDLAVVEPDAGSSAAMFTVSLSPPVGQIVTVDFATEDETAQAGSDYEAASGTLTFAPGATTLPLSILVHADSLSESVESFRLTLSNPTGGPSVAFSPGVGRIYDPGNFFTVAPCRLIDTRNAAGPFGGPSLVAGGDRTFTLTGSCGISTRATAVSVNLTVTAPSAAGNLRLYPAGTALPTVSSINYSATQTRANNAIISLSPLGALTVRCSQASGTAHFILDVNGYFE
jgi:hypothetical protein